VLAAYNAPARLPSREPLDALERTTSGIVAPISTVGMISTANAMANLGATEAAPICGREGARLPLAALRAGQTLRSSWEYRSVSDVLALESVNDVMALIN